MSVWPAPAKLNLFLHVTGRRADGYHELQTIFQLLDYGDELEFSVDDSGEIRHRRPLPGVPDEQELCVRAARLLQQHTGCPKGVEITLAKRLPQGGGLGGGSSDAATTLMALNRLWGCGLATDELAGLGLQLGADVPVFVHGHSAWAEGVGEQLTPMELPARWFLVIDPGVHVSTAAIFADPELTRDSPALTIRAFPEGPLRNDLEPLVRHRYPEVDRALDWLSRFGPARMTGSGGCVFLELPDREQGEHLLAECPPGCQGFVAQGINRHPLYQAE